MIRLHPEDYPQDGDMVTVEGEFDIYTEDGTQYCTLKNAEILDIIPMEIPDAPSTEKDSF